MKTKIFFGPPGTGKTETLLRVLDTEMRTVEPHQIAFAGFTRQAAYGALSRAMAKFGLNERDLPWFRTLHSIAFKWMRVKRAKVMDVKDLIELGKILGTSVTREVEPGEGETGARCLFIDEYARNTKGSLEEAWHDLDTGISFETVRLFSESYRLYKERKNKMDFTDMLDRFTGPLPAKVVFIDEAQDLTPAQWEFVWRAFKNAERIYFAGDDDQCIFRWAGAQVERFLDLEGEREVLGSSHRIPRSVFQVAQQVAGRISRRYEKNWGPRQEDGAVNRLGNPASLNLSEGSWLLLSRNRAQFHLLKDVAEDQGHPYMVHGKPSIDDMHVQGIRLHVAACRGKHLDHSEAKILMGALGREWKEENSDKTYKAEDLGVNKFVLWHEALLGISAEKLEYYLSILRRDPKGLTKVPRIRIDTIHGAKGAEADKVALLTDISPLTEANLARDPDSEHRTFYVGVTRAREELNIIYPQTGRWYDL